MEERTINGKSLVEIEQALKKPFVPDDFKTNRYGYKYLPVDKYRSRMDEVIGIFNYDFITSEPIVSVVGTRPHIAVTGRITIRDDKGNEVTTKAACGGAQVIMTNDKNEAVVFKNDCDSAAEDVFKRCCKSLGIAEAQLRQMRPAESPNEFNTADPTEPQELFRVKLKEAFSSLGPKGFGAMVDIIGENEPRKLIIWKAGQQEIEKFISMEQFLKSYKAGKEFSLYGYKSTFTKKGGKSELQLIMERPFANTEEG